MRFSCGVDSSSGGIPDARGNETVYDRGRRRANNRREGIRSGSVVNGKGKKTKGVALGVGVAVVYGIIHDQITVRLCVEYFSLAHPPLFPVSSPTLLGLCWGLAATVGVGLVLGYLL